MARRRGRGRSGAPAGTDAGGEAGRCESCGAAPPHDARFCHRCGAPLTAEAARARAASRRTALLVLGVAALSILATVAAGALWSRHQAMTTVGPAAERRVPGAPVDLSSMTPLEAANRLFNRVMSARERGDSAEAQRFAPMAIAAYARVASLDADAHYHLGLLHLVQGDLDGARAEIERLRQVTPHHLLALLLEHEVAARAGDAAAAAGAARAFAAAYASEIGTGRPEYVAHRASIDRFRAGMTGGER